MVKLSVLVTFCNQKQYIRCALDSILRQKTSFDYEILIGLDGNDDGSEEVIKEYLKKYSFIHLYKQSFSKLDTINIEKASLNRKFLLEKAQGEFFTILDGDDFYSDENKFQKQIDVLAKYPECIGCGCEHFCYNENGKGYSPERQTQDFEIMDIEKYIWSNRYVHNGTIIFRNIFYFGFPCRFPSNFVNDTTMTLYMLKFGHLAVLPDVMYMYRISADGIYQGQSDWSKKIYAALAAEINLKYLPEYGKALLSRYKPLFKFLYKNRRIVELSDCEVIWKFAKNNGCVFVSSLIGLNKGIKLLKYYRKRQLKKVLKNKYWKKKVRRICCFRGFSNFGDMLNLYISRYVYNWSVVPDLGNSDLYCIGSLLSTITERKTENRKTDVVGAGFHRDIVKPEDFKDKLNVYALRGKLSFQKMSQLFPVKSNVVLADPAVLVRKMVDKAKVENQNRVGVIPHYYDKNSEYLKNIKVSNLKIISVEDNPIQVMRDILSCKCVLSSSLHGLIVSDALGVPNRRVVFSDQIIGGDLKYNDYYSVYFDNLADAKRKIDLRQEIINDEKIDQIISEYVNVEYKMDEQCEKLLKIKIK